MALAAKDAAAIKELHAIACSKVATDHDIEADEEEEEEEEEDLFEINLDIVDNTPPPLNYWESCFTAATSNVVLLANCLLPIADVSKAVPTVAKACDHAFSWPAGSFLSVESIGVPTFNTFGHQDYCIKKQKHEL